MMQRHLVLKLFLTQSRPLALRSFSSTASAEYTNIEQDLFYDPVHKVNFGAENKITFFEQAESTKSKMLNVPYEVKSGSVNSGFQFVLCWMVNTVYPMGLMYSAL
jgi:hypothetical protein